jgi:hypothetical protein
LQLFLKPYLIVLQKERGGRERERENEKSKRKNNSRPPLTATSTNITLMPHDVGQPNVNKTN